MQMKISTKQILRVMAFVMAICLICVSFAGCGKGDSKNMAYKSFNEVIIESQVLATNSNYELKWDGDAKAVLYKHKNGAYWSDILYETYLDGTINSNGQSPISITVFETKTLDWTTVSSDSQMGVSGNIVCRPIENGIRVTYFFETYRIAVPVDYVLHEDHISISVDTSKILEDDIDYKLVSIALGQNVCSIENKAEGGYLFVPSGNGALMKAKETAKGILTYSSKVYGRDRASRIPMSLKDEQEARLPVFGSYQKDKGVLAIIDQGEGSAVINAEAANNRTGYSSVYAELYVRGYDTFMHEYYGQNIFTTTKRVNDNISGQVLSVSYYPLFGNEANYAGMAKKYQSYLVNKGLLKKSETKTSPYSVTFLGGTNVTKSFFGIPYQKIESLTTFSQAKDIIQQLKKDNGVLPTVRLLGYSDNGLRAGTISGGSSYPSVYGGKKALKELNEVCKDTNLFLDFDIVNYSKSGNGFTINGDVAKTAIMYKAVNFPTSPTRVNDDDNEYYIIGRDSLEKASLKAFKKAKKYSANGVSFSSLGGSAFSDYNYDKYINSNEMEEDVAKILAAAKENGYVTAVADANYYSACASDIIFDTTATSGDYDAFEYDVPFYQMVFHSYKQMYSEGVNTSVNFEKEVAKAVAYGMGLGYYITDGYVDKSNDLEEYKLFATIYEDNAPKINKSLVKDGFIEIYNSTNNAEFVGYELINGEVAKTTFSNGVVIYTNLSSKAANSPVGNLMPYEYKLG